MVDCINEDRGISCKINNKRGGWDFLENLEGLLTEKIFKKLINVCGGGERIRRTCPRDFFSGKRKH